MPRPRASMAGLMASVFVLGIGFASLKYSTEGVAGLVVLGTLGILAFATLAIAYRREGRRAFWLGFAGLGWGYMALSSSSWFEETEDWTMISLRNSGFNPKSVMRVERRPVLITTFVLDFLRPRLQAAPNPGIPAIYRPSFFGGPDARSRVIFAQLDQPLSMPFPNETPLEDVLKYIQTATTGPGLEKGIPIYVDPAGLSEAEKTMMSPVVLNLESAPLRQSLALILNQLDLGYTVNDGLLTITSPGIQATAAEAQVESFRRIGHCQLSLLIGLIGGIAGRILHATRDRA